MTKYKLRPWVMHYPAGTEAAIEHPEGEPGVWLRTKRNSLFIGDSHIVGVANALIDYYENKANN